MRQSKDQVIMLSFSRFSSDNSYIELDFLEREATAESAMRPGFRFHLVAQSLSDTVLILGWIGVDRYQTIVYCGTEANIDPIEGINPNHVAIDENDPALHSAITSIFLPRTMRETSV